MVFHEIWPEHLLIDKKQKLLANSFILSIFLVVASNPTRYAKFSIVGLDKSIRRNPIELKENATHSQRLMLCD